MQKSHLAHKNVNCSTHLYRTYILQKRNNIIFFCRSLFTKKLFIKQNCWIYLYWPLPFVYSVKKWKERVNRAWKITETKTLITKTRYRWDGTLFNSKYYKWNKVAKQLWQVTNLSLQNMFIDFVFVSIVKLIKQD